MGANIALIKMPGHYGQKGSLKWLTPTCHSWPLIPMAPHIASHSNCLFDYRIHGYGDLLRCLMSWSNGLVMRMLTMGFYSSRFWLNLRQLCPLSLNWRNCRIICEDVGKTFVYSGWARHYWWECFRKRFREERKGEIVKIICSYTRNLMEMMADKISGD